jgi:hypothetical protein
MLIMRDCLDVTLAAGGQSLRAHRVILAAASTYFEVIYSSYKNFLRDL